LAIDRDRLHSFSDLMAVNDTQVHYLISSLIPDESVTLVTGSPKAGKSLILLDAAIAIASGGSFLNLQTQQGRVLIIDQENGIRRAARRVQGLSVGRKLAAQDLPLFVYQGDVRDDHRGPKILSELCEELKPDFVIIDPLVAYLSRDGDENSSAYIRSLFNRLKGIVEKHSCAIAVVHHPRKQGTGESYSSSSARGSSDIPAAVDLHLHISRHQRRCSVDIHRSRDVVNDSMSRISYEVVDSDNGQSIRINAVSTRSSSKDSKSESIKTILKKALTTKGQKSSEVIAALQARGYKERTIRSAFSEMVEEGVADNKQYGVWKLVETHKHSE
jgi:archaellum biogenesis ATPase FlaH